MTHCGDPITSSRKARTDYKAEKIIKEIIQQKLLLFLKSCLCVEREYQIITANEITKERTLLRSQCCLLLQKPGKSDWKKLQGYFVSYAISLLFDVPGIENHTSWY